MEFFFFCCKKEAFHKAGKPKEKYDKKNPIEIQKKTTKKKCL